MNNLKLKYAMNIYHLANDFPTSEDLLYEYVKTRLKLKKDIFEPITYKNLKTYLTFSKIGDDRIQEMLRKLEQEGCVKVENETVEILKNPWS